MTVQAVGETPAPVRHVDRDGHPARGVEKSPGPTAAIFCSDACPHCRGSRRTSSATPGTSGAGSASSAWRSRRTRGGRRFAVPGTPTHAFSCHGRPVRELVGAILPAVIRHLVEESAGRPGIDREVIGAGR